MRAAQGRRSRLTCCMKVNEKKYFTNTWGCNYSTVSLSVTHIPQGVGSNLVGPPPPPRTSGECGLDRSSKELLDNYRVQYSPPPGVCIAFRTRLAASRSSLEGLHASALPPHSTSQEPLESCAPSAMHTAAGCFTSRTNNVKEGTINSRHPHRDQMD